MHNSTQVENAPVGVSDFLTTEGDALKFRWFCQKK